MPPGAKIAGQRARRVSGRCRNRSRGVQRSPRGLRGPNASGNALPALLQQPQTRPGYPSVACRGGL
eukprot:9548605-Lingulodinium_polyedra.AAC.1